jgi:hypothetical protein
VPSSALLELIAELPRMISLCWVGKYGVGIGIQGVEFLWDSHNVSPFLSREQSRLSKISTLYGVLSKLLSGVYIK